MNIHSRKYHLKFGGEYCTRQKPIQKSPHFGKALFPPFRLPSATANPDRVRRQIQHHGHPAADRCRRQIFPASTPAGNDFAGISFEIGIARASSADADPHQAPPRRRAAAPPRRRAARHRCKQARRQATAAPSTRRHETDAGLAAWLALAWTAGGGGAGLNAAEAVDMGLYARWASVPTLRVDPGDLERVGRSAD
jgi:hypothetical protein